MAATTAVTAQDTTAVYDIHHIPPQFVARQVEICIKDIGQDAVKIGMLASEETAAAVAKVLVAHSAKNIVVDPVGLFPLQLPPPCILPAFAGLAGDGNLNSLSRSWSPPAAACSSPTKLSRP